MKPENFVSLHTIMRKEMARVLRIWPQTLMPAVITMGLYLIIFGKFIGSQLSDINGFTYMEFIIPGIIMMSVITNSYSNIVSSFFGSKFQRSIEEILVSPTPSSVIIAGFVAGSVLRGLLVGFLVSLLCLLFGKVHIANLLIIFVFVILSSIVFALAGLINGIFAKKFDDISIIPTFVLTPLTYLSGVFYSIELLPPFWQAVSKLNPILYMVNGFRHGFLGFSDINIWFGLGMLIVFTIILYSANFILIQKGVGLRS
ncbi:MAG: ABC transporter permease [Planctomycetota bacterium]